MKRSIKTKVLSLALAASLVGAMLAFTPSASAKIPPVSGGTCCPESGSDCIVGTVIRENKYYQESGPCGVLEP